MGLHIKAEMEKINFNDHNIPDYQSDIVSPES